MRPSGRAPWPTASSFLPAGACRACFVSAVSGEGLDALRECIADLAVREPATGGLNRAAGASPEAGSAAAGDEGEDLRVGTYHSHA